MNRFKSKPKSYTDDELIKKGKQAVALNRVSQAIQSETLTRGVSCQICDSDNNIVAHHWKGYEFPYDVWWICNRCNVLLPFHDGVLTLDEARIYVLNRRDYNDMFSGSDGKLDGIDDDNYPLIIWNLARNYKNPRDSVRAKEFINHNYKQAVADKMKTFLKKRVKCVRCGNWDERGNMAVQSAHEELCDGCYSIMSY